MPSHLVIPDTQVKDGVPLHHLEAAGNLIATIQPDVIIHIGDHADMPSLSEYDRGKKCFEGRRYEKDILAARKGMEVLLGPLFDLQKQQRNNRKKVYKPKMLLTLGNHENRINRIIESEPRLEGTVGLSDLGYEDYGWEVVPYMQPVVVDGVAYCHFFYNKLSGRPHASARTTLLREHMSCTQGHQQTLQIETQYTGDGRRLTAVTAGAYYLHDEDYKGPSGNDHWRGLIYKQDVEDGEYDITTMSIKLMIKEWL